MCPGSFTNGIKHHIALNTSELSLYLNHPTWPQQTHHCCTNPRKMCHQVQWVFELCDSPNCFNNSRATKPYDVKVCEEFAANQGCQGPPWQLGVRGQRVVQRCPQTVVARIMVPARCFRCYEYFRVRSGAYWDLPVYEDYIEAMTHSMQVPDDLFWSIPVLPRVDVLFREVDWNPPPKHLPVDSGDVSPKSQKTLSTPQSASWTFNAILETAGLLTK